MSEANNKARIVSLERETVNLAKRTTSLAAHLDAVSMRVSLLRDNYDALERRLAEIEDTANGAASLFFDLAKRLAKLERGSQLVVPGEAGEWVRRDGCLVYDLDISQKEEHDE